MSWIDDDGEDVGEDVGEDEGEGESEGEDVGESEGEDVGEDDVVTPIWFRTLPRHTPPARRSALATIRPIKLDRHRGISS